VVFLHGLGGSRVAWGAQLRGLSSRFRCIAWDMPGYGDSALLEPLTYGGIADRFVDFLDVLDIESADVVGLSFGGMHILHTALSHPERINRMVLADTSPAFGMDGTSKEQWIADRLAPIDAGQTPADAAEAVVDAITSVTLTGQVRDETIAAFGQISPRAFRAAVHCLPHNDIRDQLASLDHEALVVVGELDEETPVGYAATLADGLPNARLHVLDGVGHLSPAEAPESFNSLVSDFLGNHHATLMETQ
jgi:pimeloyl-ACP methyl ester carboxylesterase